MLIYFKKWREQFGKPTVRARRRRVLACVPLAAWLCLTASASAHSAPKTVLVLGDSLSAEYGLSRSAGWVALLEQRLKQKNISATIVNASISGETTSGGRTRLPALLKKFNPAIVVVELGANDGLRGLPAPAAEANLRAIGDQAKSAGAEVLLVGIRIPPNYGRNYSEQIYSMYGKLSKEMHASLVPFMLEGVADKSQLFQADRLHPLAQAHPAILDNIWPHLLPMINQR